MVRSLIHRTRRRRQTLGRHDVSPSLSSGSFPRRTNVRPLLSCATILHMGRFLLVAFIPAFFLISRRHGPSRSNSGGISVVSLAVSRETKADAIVVGGGLAGLVTALSILDRGGTVIIVEKESILGGNALRASSGINACCPHGSLYGDSIDSFRSDTLRSAGNAAQHPLIDLLVEKSADALQWLQGRVGVDLSRVALMGGHSHQRTHRPAGGKTRVGAAIMSSMVDCLKDYRNGEQPALRVLLNTKVTSLLFHEGRVSGVRVDRGTGGTVETSTLSSPHVVITTGGYARGSLLATHRPDLAMIPTTAGHFSTGDGITLASEVGAGTIDMNAVQIHPTGFVDPSDEENPTKVLAAEVLRGAGGLLLNRDGTRFCNELGTRDYISDRMKREIDRMNQGSGRLSSGHFFLLLGSAAAADVPDHIDSYVRQGLLKRIDGIDELASWMKVDVTSLTETLLEYQRSATNGSQDVFDKSVFPGVPASDLLVETFHAGIVTPVLHYCMGGLTIDTEGHVLDGQRHIIEGLHAAGEVTGGVHGVNRLGGNSLLDCTVFGRVVGQNIPVARPTVGKARPLLRKQSNSAVHPYMSMYELHKHRTKDDCFVGFSGNVYDLTSFATRHPGGADVIYELAGKDGTRILESTHGLETLRLIQDMVVGTLN